MDWGSDGVLNQTQARARAAGIEFHTLPLLCDIDTWDDLVSVARLDPSLRSLVTRSAHVVFPLNPESRS